MKTQRPGSRRALYRRQRPATPGCGFTLRVVAVAASQPPPAVLRQELQDARALGVSWERAWRTATNRSLAGVHGEERDRWRAAFLWSDEFWRRAYTGLEWDRCDTPFY